MTLMTLSLKPHALTLTGCLALSKPLASLNSSFLLLHWLVLGLGFLRHLGNRTTNHKASLDACRPSNGSPPSYSGLCRAASILVRERDEVGKGEPGGRGG